MNPARQPILPGRAFTLIEMLLAVGIAAIVLTAINAVFFGALRLREGATEVTKQTLPVDRAVATIKKDLLGIVPPGTLAGPMGTDITGVGMTQPLILELYTSTGILKDDVPWADIQKIDYWLQDPTNKTAGSTGKDLIRGVTRNLLATIPEAPEPQLVVGDVENLRFSYCDGTNWNDAWSSTLSNIPMAIKVFLTFTAPKSGRSPVPPIQFLVPVISETSTN